MSDVQATTDLFIHMVATSDWANLRLPQALAGYAAPAARPEQAALFG